MTDDNSTLSDYKSILLSDNIKIVVDFVLDGVNRHRSDRKPTKIQVIALCWIGDSARSISKW